jgi:hypothetical protein
MDVPVYATQEHFSPHRAMPGLRNVQRDMLNGNDRGNRIVPGNCRPWRHQVSCR